MITELASQSGASMAVILSMLFFVAVFGVVVWRLVRQDPKEAARYARIPLDDAEPHPGDGGGADPGRDRSPGTS